MSYQVSKVRLRPDGTIYWRLFWVDRSGNDRKYTAISVKDYKLHSFSELMSFDEARARQKELNLKSQIKKQDEKKKVAASKRLNQLSKLKSAFLPETEITEFEDRILFKKFSRNTESLKYRRFLSHWYYVQKMIAEVKVDPSDYHEECHIFYQYFEQQQTSPEYVSKLIRILNAWGYFYCRKTNKPFLPMSNPRGRDKQRIADKYASKPDTRGEADRLTPEMLESTKSKLLDYNYNFLYLTCWLGLRPQECEALKDQTKWRLESQDGVQVLWIYQSKLMSVPAKKRYKPIPLLFPQQIKCLEIIKEGNFKRPLNKTLKHLFPGKRIRNYSGRKNFVDLLLNLGQKPEDISIMLGHSSIETTWQFYKDKQQVRFTKPAA